MMAMATCWVPRPTAPRIPTIARTRPAILAVTASPIVGQVRRTWCRSMEIRRCIRGLGSIVGMTDSAGNEVNRYDYDPYGVMLHQQEQSGFTNLFKFAGGQYRSSTGLYKFGERYYDPKLGRWTQLDSAGTGYVYTNDNPVNEVDPSGKVSGDCGVAFVALISQGLGTARAGLMLN